MLFGIVILVGIIVFSIGWYLLDLKNQQHILRSQLIRLNSHIDQENAKVCNELLINRYRLVELENRAGVKFKR